LRINFVCEIILEGGEASFRIALGPSLILFSKLHKPPLSPGVLMRQPLRAAAHLIDSAISAVSWTPLRWPRLSPGAELAKPAPVVAPYAPEGISEEARRYFIRPFAMESLELAHAAAALLSQPMSHAETVESKAAMEALSRVNGPLPLDDGERIIGMALNAHREDLAIACSDKGMYYPWRKGVENLRAVRQDLEDESADKPAEFRWWAEEFAALDKLIEHANQPALWDRDENALRERNETIKMAAIDTAEAKYSAEMATMAASKAAAKPPRFFGR